MAFGRHGMQVGEFGRRHVVETKPQEEEIGGTGRATATGDTSEDGMSNMLGMWIEGYDSSGGISQASQQPILGPLEAKTLNENRPTLAPDLRKVSTRLSQLDHHPLLLLLSRGLFQLMCVCFRPFYYGDSLAIFRVETCTVHVFQCK